MITMKFPFLSVLSHSHFSTAIAGWFEQNCSRNFRKRENDLYLTLLEMFMDMNMDVDVPVVLFNC